MWNFLDFSTSDEIDPDVKEQLFHNAVREYIITLLVCLSLYVSAYLIIHKLIKPSDFFELYACDEEDSTVYRISSWSCILTLAVSLGAILLLPMSLLSNEVIRLYPDSWYLRWLNHSLIHSLWNTVSLFSNIVLFLALPFAYFFLDSEGFPGCRRRLRWRVVESLSQVFTVLFLVSATVCMILCLVDEGAAKNITVDWQYHIAFLYSCISFCGVVLLLVCAPLGLTVLFTVLGQLVAKPQRGYKLQDDLDVSRLRQLCLQKFIERREGSGLIKHGGDSSTDSLEHDLQVITKTCEQLEQRLSRSGIRRTLEYPILLLLLTAMTSLSVLFATRHSLELLIDEDALHITTQELMLGSARVSWLGLAGVVVETVLLFYLLLAALVGLYSLPVVRKLRPKPDNTPMTHLLANCALLLLLASALPVLVRTLGLTKFDLLGDFGRVEWLQHFWIVLSFNLLFTVSSALCLFTKFTSSMRIHILRQFQLALGARLSLRKTVKRSQRAYTDGNVQAASLNSAAVDFLMDEHKQLHSFLDDSQLTSIERSNNLLSETSKHHEHILSDIENSPIGRRKENFSRSCGRKRSSSCIVSSPYTNKTVKSSSVNGLGGLSTPAQEPSHKLSNNFCNRSESLHKTFAIPYHNSKLNKTFNGSRTFTPTNLFGSARCDRSFTKDNSSFRELFESDDDSSIEQINTKSRLVDVSIDSNPAQKSTVPATEPPTARATYLPKLMNKLLSRVYIINPTRGSNGQY